MSMTDPMTDMSSRPRASGLLTPFPFKPPERVAKGRRKKAPNIFDEDGLSKRCLAEGLVPARAEAGTAHSWSLSWGLQAACHKRRET